VLSAARERCTFVALEQRPSPSRTKFPFALAAVLLSTIVLSKTNQGVSLKVMRILGIILIVIGLLTLALPYVTFTKKEKVLDIGPVEAVAETKETIPISPIIGAVILVAGAGIVIASMRKGPA
jgi:uncharacterized membrane protein YidH (DUF202 family)